MAVIICGVVDAPYAVVVPYSKLTATPLELPNDVRLPFNVAPVELILVALLAVITGGANDPGDWK